MIYNRIKAFVGRLAPELVCDSCVVERLEVGDDAAPVAVLHELAGSPEFERQVGPCALCGENTQAIRRKAR